jgi:hypothetical protein
VSSLSDAERVSSAFVDDPYPFYRRVRREAPLIDALERVPLG